MIFYFSGVSSAADAQILKQAGVEHILVDMDDLPVLLETNWQGRIAIDSGSYRAFKSGKRLDPDAYIKRLDWLEGLAVTSTDFSSGFQGGANRYDFIAAPDVIGDPETTLSNWLYLTKSYRNALRSRLMPVWQWGASIEHLRLYLDTSPSGLVGLGGLVPLIRDRRSDHLSDSERKTWDKARQKVLDQVLQIAQAYPGRFHLLGLCWVKAFNVLKPYLASGDSSLWLEGARYRFAIFQHSKTGKLSHAPAGMFPEFKSLDRSGLLLANAANIERFVQAG